MAPRRILPTDGESLLREALARALSSEGHEVQVSDTLSRPVNMEELRRTLRDM